MNKYEAENDLGRFFSIKSRDTVEKYIYEYMPRLNRLMEERLPSSLHDVDDGFIFMMTVDGTHCPINEQRPFSTEWSSFKLGGKPGVNYEVGLHIHKPKILWIYGPTKAGEHNDVGVFQQKLKHELPHGRRCLGDDIYKGEPDYFSTKNDLDPPELSKFKDCAMTRQENCNKRLKNFDIIKDKPFRHGVDCGTGVLNGNHKMAFYACACVVSYGLDNGSVNLLETES
jgi:hypothetical protein